MAKEKEKEGVEKTVKIDGVNIPQSALDSIPIGATFTVIPSERVAAELGDSQESETATIAEPEKPIPNLIWSSERVYKKTGKDGAFTVISWVDKPTEEDTVGKPKFGEPVDSVQIGLRQIKLPDAVTQKKGFYHPEAKLLRRVVGGLKEFKPKG